MGKYRFDIGESGQQIHISSKPAPGNEFKAARHPCFKVESPEALVLLQGRIWGHFEGKSEGAPVEVSGFLFFYFLDIHVLPGEARVLEICVKSMHNVSNVE